MKEPKSEKCCDECLAPNLIGRNFWCLDFNCPCHSAPAEKSGGEKEGKVGHRMYCAKSEMRCLVIHPDGICPDVRDCEACRSENGFIQGIPPASGGEKEPQDTGWGFCLTCKEVQGECQCAERGWDPEWIDIPERVMLREIQKAEERGKREQFDIMQNKFLAHEALVKEAHQAGREEAYQAVREWAEENVCEPGDIVTGYVLYFPDLDSFLTSNQDTKK